MEIKTEKKVETICPVNQQEWRSWLEENHYSKQAVWLIYYKKKSGNFTISWSEAVDEALCFGWIDSKAKPLDAERFMQFFTKRKPKSVWSKINKEKIKRLTDEGLITPAGYESIEIAKQNGSWTILDEVEELIIPPDLEKAFQIHTGSKDYFLSLSKSVRKSMLQWLVMAKRPETRQKRIDEIAVLSAQKLKPKQF
ncbi:YdeI/OmpD-associated family protein [Adhaeribacter rhizoryzae]|uniref:Bacteriocin-protection protein n=1 Tax=Adhaeribacter rhizoryzae TaxID=2607907 RepID=A0A5M6DR85_9BACT|nr:YdeI/OmpD-associated family protein [Adhaeribacter rhizoryzae]KAA5547925.1 hypothetical protein F0145_08285 [Adhaeribacter rhizoryzae]